MRERICSNFYWIFVMNGHITLAPMLCVRAGNPIAYIKIFIKHFVFKRVPDLLVSRFTKIYYLISNYCNDSCDFNITTN